MSQHWSSTASRNLVSLRRHGVTCRPTALLAQTGPRRPVQPQPLFSTHASPLRSLVQEFEPARPPSPASLGVPRKARTYTRGRQWSRRLLALSAVLGAGYLVDRQAYASGFARSLRTFGLGLLVACDYKINFREKPLPVIGADGGISELHRRNADRLFDLLRHNGGLYLKIGQAIAMQSALLPAEFQKMFARMFDDAPQAGWAAVERVLLKELGAPPEKYFAAIEHTARASASVAQVHWALRHDGREVAVKVQKPEIARQISWDLWAFKVVMRIYTLWFDLPLYSMVPYINERLMLETDFENEAHNSELMRRLILNEPRLNGRVYVPKVHEDLSSRRLLTTEWIEGVRLWDKEGLTRPWRGGREKASLGSGPGAPLLPRPDLHLPPHTRAKAERNDWRGTDHKGGLGLSPKEIMTIMIDLFSAQIFRWGVVHCDPHPGNIFVRRQRSGRAELVLIDHGLYVYMSEHFRQQYATFWKALMTFDDKTIAKVTEQWGIKGADMFASATLMRPYEGGSRELQKIVLDDNQAYTRSERSFAMQQRMKQGIRDMLADEDRWPKELIFIGRTLRIVMGNNQYLGSPVNRVKRMGQWASRSLFEDERRPLTERLGHAWRHVLFQVVLVLSDVAFYLFRLRQCLGRGGGMEDEFEARLKEMAGDYGLELQHDVFDG